jgi:hypothetical protein
VLHETEDRSKPADGLGKILVGDVGKHGVDGDGTVFQDGRKIRRQDGRINRLAAEKVGDT